MRIEQPVDSPALPTPGAPGAGRFRMYVKSDGIIYTLDSGGTERGGATGSGPFAPSMTGATAGTRYVGGTSGGAPTTGTFAVGDFVVDRVNGTTYICTVAGTPGTWVSDIDAVNAEVSNRAAADSLLIPLTQRAVAYGVATLDSAGDVPVAQLPVIPVANGGTGAGTAAAARTALAVPSTNYIWSRGMNLVTNGTALLGDNTNFSGFTFDGSDTPGGGGGFKPPLNNSALASDETIPVDPDHTYMLIAWARERTAALTSYLYLGLTTYDIDGLLMDPSHVMYQASTTTTLAAALNPGDTTVSLTSAANWNNAAGASTYLRSFIFWNYTNARGYLWPTRTYSRNVYANKYADGAISGNVITLSAAWSGPAITAGTAVSNATSGGSYKYVAAANVSPGNVWTKYSGVIGGIDTTGTAPTNQFSYGTAYIKMVVLPNRSAGGSYLATSNQVFANFWFSEAAPVAGPFAPSMTGVLSATRYVGGTSGAPPGTGTFVAGDFAVDRSNGSIYVCTVGGSPGTWLALGARSALAPVALGAAAAGSSTSTSRQDHVHPTTGVALSTGPFAPSGFTGATVASRYVGAVSTGLPPTSGTFAVGDFVIDASASGAIFICTVAGTPGTWVTHGPLSATAPIVSSQRVAAAGSASPVAARWDHVHPSNTIANSFMLMGS